MQALEKIAFGNYYHIYNRGVNGCNIFRENANYEYISAFNLSFEEN